MTTPPVVDLTGVDLDALAREQELDRQNPPPWEAPRTVPSGWVEKERDVGECKYVSRARRLAVILSCSKERDGRWWIHLSVSHRGRVPTWDEVRWCKEVFLGDREAYAVLPPKARYANIHPRTLHLFTLLDPKIAALPDFTRGTGSL